MSIDVFTMKCASLAEAKIVGFRGTEHLSRPFEFDVFFTLATGTDVRPAVGARASLIADRQDDRGPMAWHGILARIRLLHQTDTRVLYQALLVPKMWLLRHSARSRVYTKASGSTGTNTIKDFVSDTFEHGGLVEGDFSFQIDEGSYPDEELVIQYRESHLDFASRWLEREGIYYYFEQPPAEDAEEKLLLVDRKSLHEPLGGDGKVWYFSSGSADVTAGEGLFELHADYERLPASVQLTDYNYDNPSAPVRGTAAVSSSGQGEIRDYGYRVFDEGEATRLAGIKAESISCRELVVHARGNAMFLRAGYTFEIEDRPEGLPAKCLAIEVRHAGSLSGASEEVRRYTGLAGNETYRVEVKAIDAEVQFRASQLTPWPRIYGFENGTVCGEAESPYAQIDDQGRYLVRFKFDASELPDGKASCWVRMMQPHGGTTEGFHFPLRKGTEVMLAFLGGDPDRPFVAGVVPTAQRKSPVTSKNHTHNEIRTGGGSYVVIEDLDGKQYIDISTPTLGTNIHMGDPRAQDFSVPNKDQQSQGRSVSCSFLLNTGGTAGFAVGGEWWQNVGKNLFLDVTGAGTVRYGGRYLFDVEGNSDEFYHAFRNTEVTSGRTDKVLGGGMVQEIAGGLTHTVTGGVKHDLSGGLTHIVKGGSWHDITGVWEAKASGNVVIESTGGTVTIKSPTVIVLQAEEVKNTAGSKWFKTTSFSVELFGSKNAAGIQKFDATAVARSINGSKKDLTVSSMGICGIKRDVNGMKQEITGLATAAIGAKFDVYGVTLKNNALRVINAGFIKEG